MKKIIILFFILCSSFSTIIAKTYIRKGANKNGQIMYYYDSSSKFVREGQTSYSSIINYVDNNRIRIVLTPRGPIKYNVDKNFIRKGDTKYGEI